MHGDRSTAEDGADALPQRPIEETARLGDAIYEERVRARVEREHYGDVVAIDVNSGDYAVADEVLAAADALRQRRPNADIWFVRVGFRALDRIGGAANLGNR